MVVVVTSSMILMSLGSEPSGGYCFAAGETGIKVPRANQLLMWHPILPLFETLALPAVDNRVCGQK
jgi:hypothetical protein